MSSYLTIYLKIKDSDKKIELNSWSRNNDIYQKFNESLHPVWASNEDIYTDISEQDILNLIDECDKDIKRCQELKEHWIKKHSEYEDALSKIVSSMDISKPSAIVEFIRRYREENDYCNDIEGQDELIADYKYCQDQLYFLLGIIENIKYCSNPDITGLCCNIT